MSSSIQLFNSIIEIADDQSNLVPSCTRTKPVNFKSANEYSRYIINCLTPIVRQGYTFYQLPVSFKLYRGDFGYNLSKSTPSGFMAFNFNAKDASNQGLVHEFLVTKTTEVLALDSITNLQILTAQAITDQKYDVVKALEFNFKIGQDNRNQLRLIRQENKVNDLTILKYLCEQGLSGFSFYPLNNRSAQIFLCDPKSVLSLGQYSKYNSFFVEKISR